MLRRPIESKSTGPYRKLLMIVLDELIVSGTELNKDQVYKAIIGLDSKMKNSTDTVKAEFLKQLSISEETYIKFLNFLRNCYAIMNTPLPYNTFDKFGKMLIKPKERCLRYENFNYQLILNSEKLNNEISPGPGEFLSDPNDPNSWYSHLNPIYNSSIIRDKIKDSNGNLITIDEPYVICSFCEATEHIMLHDRFTDFENKYYTYKNATSESDFGIINNGFDFSQNGGAQNYYYDGLLDNFLQQLRIDEVKNTYWCSYCGSLTFTRAFSKINQSTIEIGTTIIAGEEIPQSIVFSFPQHFIIYASGSFGKKLGEFVVYGSGIQHYTIQKLNSTTMEIVDSDSLTVGIINFNIANKTMDIALTYQSSSMLEPRDEIRTKARVNTDNNENVTFFIELDKSIFLLDQLDSIEEYEGIRLFHEFDSGDIKDYTGCIIRNDILSPPVKWVPKRVTFGQLRNYPFPRLGIDLTLFLSFKN